MGFRRKINSAISSHALEVINVVYNDICWSLHSGHSFPLPFSIVCFGRKFLYRAHTLDINVGVFK